MMNKVKNVECRVGCGACCIAASITSPLPNMPAGKPAGMRCFNLSEDYRCRIWGTPEYPAVCRDFLPERTMCGNSREEALQVLREWEALTAP